jgi:hypothetical protein
MRKLSFTLLLYFSINPPAFSRNGLENIIVETYYISSKADVIHDGGKLEMGSVTYRIFADMLPGYRFQAAYGLSGHPLKISTTTSFFNNELFGSVSANDIPVGKLKFNTVMLDSWLSVGAISSVNFGVLKKEDTSVAIVNADGILENTDDAAGIPISKKDGMIPMSPVPVITYFGIDSAMLNLFSNKNVIAEGQEFITGDGSWASFGGTAGVDSSNRVIIAQITTDGHFSFELNIQIGTPVGTSENYVARDPVGDEKCEPFLIYNSTAIHKNASVIQNPEKFQKK